MAKKNRTGKKDAVINSVINTKTSKFEENYSKYFWLIIPVLAILYYSYKFISQGFYQDDEVAQYLNMLHFWNDPSVILGNGPKPGYKIFIVPFSLISYDAVLFGNSLIAASTVYLTYYMLRLYGIPYAFIGALLLATQPLYVNLSFRSYSEIFTALLIVLFLIAYKKEKIILSSLILSYIFTVRQEIALLIAGFFIYYIIKKKYTAALMLAVFPILYDLLGWIKTGDPLFILTEMSSVAGLNYKSQGLLHYFKVYVFIVGPVCFSLFIVGFFGFVRDLNNTWSYIKKYLIFYIIFVMVFIIQMLTMLNDGPNPGNWRYLLHISPICAFFACIGINNLIDVKFRKTGIILLMVSLFYVILFSAKETDGFALLERADYTKVVFILILISGFYIFKTDNIKSYYLKFGGFAVILSLIFLYFVENKKLSNEYLTVKEVSSFLTTIPEVDNKVKLTNHPFIIFYSDVNKNNINSFKKLDLNNLNTAGPGSLLVWESHYGYRPEFKNDVQLELLSDSTKFRMIKQNILPDRSFGAFVFEKLY